MHQLEVLMDDAGNPRRERLVRAHRAGNYECAGRAAYARQHGGGPGYTRVDANRLRSDQLLCRHPGCFQDESPGATVRRLQDAPEGS
jgi:hypothetical protein